MNDVAQRDVLSPEGLTQLVDGMLATQAEYETASGGGDFATCDALMADAWTKLRRHDAALRELVAMLEWDRNNLARDLTAAWEREGAVQCQRDEARRLAEYVRDRVPKTASWISDFPWETSVGETPSP